MSKYVVTVCSKLRRENSCRCEFVTEVNGYKVYAKRKNKIVAVDSGLCVVITKTGYDEIGYDWDELIEILKLSDRSKQVLEIARKILDTMDVIE